MAWVLIGAVLVIAAFAWLAVQAIVFMARAILMLASLTIRALAALLR